MNSEADLIWHPGYIFRDRPVVDLLSPFLKAFRLELGENVSQNEKTLLIESSTLFIGDNYCHSFNGTDQMDGLVCVLRMTLATSLCHAI